MAASSTSSWLHTSLLSPSTQQQASQHTLYETNLSSHLPHQQQQQQLADVGHDGRHHCGAFCQPHQCALNLDFHHAADSQQLPDFSRPAGASCSGHVGAGAGNGGHLSSRKIHKADREKLRRDRLNEQFAELAGVLDPDRPKNDKATILGDSVQVVKELRSEVKRLRTEHTALLDESRDLAQEKTEFREEKASLKSETEHLQGQIQQRLRLMLPWMGMDPSMMMGASPYGYPIPLPQPVSASPPSDLNQPGQQGSLQQPVAPPPAYMPLAPVAPGAYALHPALQGYTMYGNRPGDGTTPYLPYPHYPSQVSTHSHVERPYPQYPTPLQSHPGYLMQMQPHQGQTPMSGAPPVASMYQSFAPSMSLVPSRSQGMQPNGLVRGAVNVPPNAPSGPDGALRLQPRVDQYSVQTTLQLQTPVHPQAQRPSQVNPPDGTEGSTNTQSGGTGSAVSGLQKESNAPTSGSGNVSALTTGSAGLCSPDASSTCNRELVVSQVNKDVSVPQQKDPVAVHDPALRPPVAVPQQKDPTGTHDPALRPPAAVPQQKDPTGTHDPTLRPPAA